MKLSSVLLTLAFALVPNMAFSMVAPCFQYVLQGEMKIELVQPEAGFEFPTETAPFPELAAYDVLKIGEGVRILVANSATLKCGYLAIDDFYIYLPRAIEKAIAGIDFPTDGPAQLDRDFAVWVLNDGQRIRINSIDKIIRAEAGIDFPTDGPAQLPRDFHVMILNNGTRIDLDR